MNKLVLCLLAALVGVSAAMPALAQDASVAPTRIVIAPPQNALAQTIKDGLSAAYSSAAKGSIAYGEAQKLYFFYGARHFEPIWLDEAANGDIAFSASAQKILTLFAAAGSEGLRPTDYLTPALDTAGAKGDPRKLAALETAFSAATMRYASNIYTGRIRPLSISENLDIQQKLLDQSALMLQLASSPDPVAVLNALEPTHPEFLALKAALAKFDSGGVDQPIHIADGKTLKPGMDDARVPALRERLKLPALADTLYDDSVVAAVKAFQQARNLAVDGVMGPATLRELNGGAALTKADILANMERWRWMPRDLGAFNVLVNIPEYRLSINRDNQ
ncbi:MAG TPA: peptidoglycan-binding protein, partial [Devosia sp.]|nr:peptidoglycan-binding protein [Devosia sp.]